MDFSSSAIDLIVYPPHPTASRPPPCLSTLPLTGYISSCVMKCSCNIYL